MIFPFWNNHVQSYWIKQFKNFLTCRPIHPFHRRQKEGVTGFTLSFLCLSIHNVDTTLCDKVCQWLTCSRSVISPSSLISSTNKTDRHDITEILKMAFNTINPSPPTLFTMSEWGLLSFPALTLYLFIIKHG